MIVGGFAMGGAPVTLHQKNGKRVFDVMDTLPMLRSGKGSGKRGKPCKPCPVCLNSGGRMTKQGSLLDATIVA